jgi:hypothetical protein
MQKIELRMVHFTTVISSKLTSYIHGNPTFIITEVTFSILQKHALLQERPDVTCVRRDYCTKSHKQVYTMHY